MLWQHFAHTTSTKMTYKGWTITTREENSGVAVDYTDPNGKIYVEPFCFRTQEGARTYARDCIDLKIRQVARTSPMTVGVAQAVA